MQYRKHVEVNVQKVTGDMGGVQAATQQVRDMQKQNKALVAELERLHRVKDARIAQLEQARSAYQLTCLP